VSGREAPDRIEVRILLLVAKEPRRRNLLGWVGGPSKETDEIRSRRPLLSVSTPATLAVKARTSSIPIVMVEVADPVGSGLVASLGRPGSNVTGLSALTRDLSGKRLELLKTMVPSLSRVAVLIDAANPGASISLSESEVAAKSLGVSFKASWCEGLRNLNPRFQPSCGHCGVEDLREATRQEDALKGAPEHLPGDQKVSRAVDRHEEAQALAAARL
jgi:ABC transporter substrate binding protein